MTGHADAARERPERPPTRDELAHLASFPTLNPHPVLEIDADGQLTYCNPAAARLFPDLPARGRAHPLLAGLDLTGYAAGATPTQGCEVAVGDAVYHLALFAVPGHARLHLYALDITARARAEEALRRQALHDALTGLPNRTLLHDRLEQALCAAARDTGVVALLLFDLDRFKEVNDTLGHHAGDLLLQEVAARVRGALRASDTVARLGGDEFAVVLPGADAAAAVTATHTLLAVLAPPITLDGQALACTASIGIALAPTHGTDVATVLRRADVAMYVAKRAGGGYAVYDLAHDQHSPTRLTLETELRAALAAGALVLHYQPTVNVRSGRADRVEALVRWPHPQHGLIPPDQFIPLAEQTGLIVPLTYWVLETALRQCQAWERGGLRLGVAVNLSARALHDAQLPSTLAWLLRRYAVAPGALTLEITESALMIDPDQARVMLERLAALGVQLAIDDFGTGYSSLGYLKHLPVDEVKIDKSFVQSMSHTVTKDSAIVRSIIELGHNLGLVVVAEGVEDHGAWERLRAAGCDVAQGYYMGRPVPAPDLERWMTTSPWGQGAATG